MNPVTYNQPSASPTPKIAAAGIGGTVTTILLYGLKVFLKVDVPAEVGAALATVIAFAVGYFTRDKKPVSAVQAIVEAGSTEYKGGL